MYRGRCEINSAERSTKWVDFVLDNNCIAIGREKDLVDAPSIGAAAVFVKDDIVIFGGDSRYEIPKVIGLFSPDTRASVEVAHSPRGDEGSDHEGDQGDEGGRGGRVGGGKSGSGEISGGYDNDSVTYSISNVSIA